MTTRRAAMAWALFAACCVSLAACIPTPPTTLREARTAVPETFGGEEEGATASADDAPSAAELDWHDLLGDPQLAALIDLALENNQELNIAIQEMVVANSDVMARRGDIFPSLAAGASVGLDRVGRFTSQGQSDERAGVAPDLPGYSLGLYASWEVDIWGRLRDSANASMYRYLASAEGRNFMITRLVAEIATRYYELVALDRQLTILSDSIRLQTNALDMMRLQQQAARVTMLAVTRFEAQLRGFQSRQYEIAQQILSTENQINFLVGRFPQHVERTTQDFLTITPPVVHAGLPARMLENRPDVRQAELGLTASQLDVSAARARFYPSMRLDMC